MNITGALVDLIELEGVKLADRQDVYRSIDDAICQGRFSFIRHNGKNIGFFTWERHDKDIFVRNMLVFREYRGKFNLLSLRGFFKEKYGSIGAFHWRSRKKDKSMRFKQKETLCNCPS